MDLISAAFEWLVQRYNLPMFVLVLTAGTINLIVDSRQMQFRGLARERAWAIGIGLFYLTGGVGLWVAVRWL